MHFVESEQSEVETVEAWEVFLLKKVCLFFFDFFVVGIPGNASYVGSGGKT